MSTKKKIATDLLARHPRLWVFPAGAVLGWLLAKLVGTPLYGELQALRFLFLPVSAFLGGAVALGAWTYFGDTADRSRDAVRRRHLRIAFAALVTGVVLLLGLCAGFARRIDFNGGSVTFLVGWSRSGLCECSADDATCIQEMKMSPGQFGVCWNGRSAVRLALWLSYLLTLGSVGVVTGLLMARAAPSGAPPPAPGYLDFDVWIDPKADGGYRTKAWSDAGFEAMGSFILRPDFMNGGSLAFGGGAFRGGGTPGAGGSTLERAGAELFHTVFQDEILKAFQGCLAKAKGGPGMRIRLRLKDAPQLAGLPWEYLYDGQGFLALSARTPVVRYLEVNDELSTFLVEPPLRVLAVISTPRGYRELAEADEEWRRLCLALEPLRHGGLIEIERLAHPTPAALEERLRTGKPVHVLHFVGHGGFSELRGEGVLIFEDEQGEGLPVSGPSLAYLFQDHRSLRLAVLNACNGARSSDDNAFAGTAQVLVQRGVPAVIAMQVEVMDETACSFAEKFYRALAGGLPVDACVGEVRRALAEERNPEWGTPVLYLRATDGRLFSLENGGSSN